MAPPVTAFAQGGTVSGSNLPEGAVVSALGRTARVRSDGSFTIPTVPVTLGRFRVRLVTLDGQVGMSDCLTPVVNGITIVPAITFNNVTPIPASVTLTAPFSSFSFAGQTAQMRVIGNNPDGTQRDLTADQCTTYFSSNPRLATVDGNGRVTLQRVPLSPSTVVINVLNEGVTGTFSFSVMPDTSLNLGQLVYQGDDGWVTRNLPFSFTFYGRTYNTVYVNNNGNIAFSGGDSNYSPGTNSLLLPQPRIAAFWADLINDRSNPDSGLYINSQIPGRFVVTWFQQLRYFQVPGPNTIQMTLFPDGRIQIAYQGISTLTALVGLSPGGLTQGNPLAHDVDFRNTPNLSLNAGEAAYHFYGFSDQFNLDRSFLLFAPNINGGYDIRTGNVSPLGLSSVAGRVVDANGNGVFCNRVEIYTSCDTTACTIMSTDANGRFLCPNVLAGGMVTIKAYNNGVLMGLGGVAVPRTDITAQVMVKPAPDGPQKH